MCGLQDRLKTENLVGPDTTRVEEWLLPSRAKENGRRCAAFTLVELLIAMSLGTALMLLAAQLLHQTFDLRSSMESHANTLQSRRLLVRQFRQDVHHCMQLMSAEPDRVLLKLRDECEVEYRWREARLVRLEKRDETIVRREDFKIGQNTKIEFEQASNPSRVSLTLRTQGELKNVDARLERHVAAVLGRSRLP